MTSTHTTPATSSSARINAARSALNATQRGNSARGLGEANKHIADLSAALRALIEPAAIAETPAQAVGVIMADHFANIIPRSTTSDDVRTVATAAYLAGIQAAWNSWEPDDYAEANS